MPVFFVDIFCIDVELLTAWNLSVVAEIWVEFLADIRDWGILICDSWFC
jgi:hypothetical protein